MTSVKTVLLIVLCLGAAAPVFAAADLPGDAQTYVNRRKACNYWPLEHASRKTERLRRAEIDHHVRELQCQTLDREEAVLNARYMGKLDILAAIANAHDELPD